MFSIYEGRFTRNDYDYEHENENEDDYENDYDYEHEHDYERRWWVMRCRGRRAATDEKNDNRTWLICRFP